MAIVHQHRLGSVAFPIIGAGSGGYNEDAALGLMLDALGESCSTPTVTLVRYKNR
jgi:O-acetyl-ADP-ribose deacetylase (regulator of RNase III)